MSEENGAEHVDQNSKLDDIDLENNEEMQKHLFSNYDVDDGEIISVETLHFMLEQLNDYEKDGVFVTMDEFYSLIKSHLNSLLVIQKLQES